MKSISTEPKVSIGLPVYNGENYLKEAIESHLSQSYENFELFLSDNASTDGTRDICEHYAKQDARIQYYRNETNIGGFANFSRLVDFAEGEYFKWSAHDDVIHSVDFLKSCVEKLDSDPSIIICTSKEVAIDKNSDILENYMDKYPELENLHSTSAFRRFHDTTYLNHGCFKVFGLMRTSVLKDTPRLADFVGSDRTLLAELSLIGPFWESPETIYYRRHEEQYCAIQNDKERIKWYKPDNKRKNSFSNSTYFVQYLKSISRVDLSWSQQILCYLVLLDWIKKNRKKLFKESLISANDHLSSIFR